MPRPRTGSHVWRNGLLYARISYRDEATGKLKQPERRVPSNKMIELPRILRELENDYQSMGPEVFDGQKVTFKEAAEAYKKEHIKEAVIVEGKKLEGLKNPRDQERAIETLVAHFGTKRLSKIDYKQIKAFKNKRLNTKTRRGTNYKVASVNRELEVLRQVIRFAQGQGWVIKNPFRAGSPLINKADETERMTILGSEDEAKLLAQCIPPRAHLRSIVVVAIDTFMRKGELFKLIKSDIDFDRGIIRIRSTTTKTERPREVGLTQRALLELRCITQYLKPESKVFTLGFVKRSWETACRQAKLKDVRFHDLRHTGITRRLKAVVRAGLPWQLVMKESGHTQLKTFMRYFNPDDAMLAEAAKAMTELYAKEAAEQKEKTQERPVEQDFSKYEILTNSPHVN
jgi:integrase